MKLKPKQRWANLTVKSVILEEKMEIGPPIAGLPQSEWPRYWGGDYLPAVIELECACGNIVKIAEDEFPGRAVMKSCGLDSCSIGRKKSDLQVHNGRLAFMTKKGQKRVVAQVYIDSEIRDEITRLAKEQSESFSRMAGIIWIEGLIVRGWKPDRLTHVNQPKDKKSRLRLNRN